MVNPIFSESSVKLIFLFASMTSTFTIIAIMLTSNRQIVFGFHLNGIPQKTIENRSKYENYKRSAGYCHCDQYNPGCIVLFCQKIRKRQTAQSAD